MFSLNGTLKKSGSLGRWETKQFIGMALIKPRYSLTKPAFPGNRNISKKLSSAASNNPSPSYTPHPLITSPIICIHLKGVITWMVLTSQTVPGSGQSPPAEFKSLWSPTSFMHTQQFLVTFPGETQRMARGSSNPLPECSPNTRTEWTSPAC